MKKILVSLTIICILILQFHTYIRKEFPYTHDGENHLARFANYKIAVKEGQIPPRFAPNLVNHYGYPVFNFNYPLANILSLPFSLMKINVESSFKIISVFSSFFGLIGLYQYFSARKAKIDATIICLLLFGLNPYIINIILFRGNIGELIATQFMPWLVYFVVTAQFRKKISLAFIMTLTAFFLSHNVTVLIFTPWLAILAFVIHFKNWVTLKKLALTFFFSLMLSCWFWIPAIAEASFTVLSDVDITKEFSRHFITGWELLLSPLQFGFSLPVKIDTLSFQIGIASVASLFFSLVSLLKIYSHRKFPSTLKIFFFCSTIVFIFFQLPISHFFWNFLPRFQIIQFPWRLSVLLPLLISCGFIEFHGYLSNNLKLIIIFCIILQSVITYNLKPVDFFHKNQVDYDVFAQSTSTQNENRARTFVYENIADWQPHPSLNTQGQYTVINWTGTKRVYKLDLKQESIVTEPTMNFPGWSTIVTSENNSKYVIQYLFDQSTSGRIGYKLPPGKYTVSTHFTEFTTARIIGDLLSIFAGFFIIVYSFYHQKYNES